MKKWIFIIVALILLIAGGAYYYYNSHLPKSIGEKAAPKSAFDSIKDALSKSVSLKCNFTDEQARQTTVYIKAGAVRVDSIAKNPNEENGQTGVIMKDKMLYEWDMVKKQGMTMKLETPSVTGSQVKAPTGMQTQDGSSDNKSDDVLATIEKYKNSCQAAVVDSSLFTPPADVKFTDLSKMMQVTGSPSAPNGQAPMSQDQINQMMQQYKNQIPTSTQSQ